MKELHDAVLSGNAKAARTFAEEAIAGGMPPLDVVQKVLSPAMNEIGIRFEANECFIPELLLAARAMKGAMEIIQPLLAGSDAEPVGRVVIATVSGDLHDIGKNLVSSLLEGAGFEVVDLGVDVGPEQIVEAVKNSAAEIVALSALLTTTMPAMKSTVSALEAAGVRDRVKILVGGAPITQRFADEIGADGYSNNAAGAATLAKQVVGAA
jgi:5-methyltetrahydrofolate--homocysteine methyltransferase